MSRIGKQPIPVPAGVSIEAEGARINATGPKGTLSVTLMPGIALKQEPDQMQLVKERENPDTQKSYGLMRTLVANMVTGVSTGFSKQLEVNGVGYRASVSGQSLNLTLGFSHPIEYKLPKGIEAKVEKNIITISGADKQMVGQVAADIRALRKPEPYKGKGIRYIDERVRRKAGKTATKG